MLIAILSDIHSNHIALDFVIRDAKSRGVDEFWCLGDVIDFGWQPVEVLSALGPLIKFENWVMGNHDACYAGILEPGKFKFGVESQIMMKHNKVLIDNSPIAKDYVKNFFSTSQQPPKMKIKDGMVCYLTHSGYDTGYRYPWFDTRPLDEDAKNLFKQIKTHPVKNKSWKIWEETNSYMHILFFGHTHLPVMAYFDETQGEMKIIKVRSGTVDLRKDCNNSRNIVINPGSVGMPRDLLPYPSYVIMDTKKRQIEFRRVREYNPELVIKGYSTVKRDIAKYLPDGLNELDAEVYIWNIENQIKKALHPNLQNISQDWRDFYEGKNNVEQVE